MEATTKARLLAGAALVRSIPLLGQKDAQVDWPNKFQGGSVPAAKKK